MQVTSVNGVFYLHFPKYIKMKKSGFYPQVVRDESVKGPVPEYVKENRFAKLLNIMT